MADEMIVRLFGERFLNLCVAHLLGDKEASAFFLGMFAGHDFLESLLEDGPCVGSAAIELLRGAPLGEQTLVGELALLLALLRVGGVEEAVDLGVESRCRLAEFPGEGAELGGREEFAALPRIAGALLHARRKRGPQSQEQIATDELLHGIEQEGFLRVRVHEHRVKIVAGDAGQDDDGFLQSAFSERAFGEHEVMK